MGRKYNLKRLKLSISRKCMKKRCQRFRKNESELPPNTSNANNNYCNNILDADKKIQIENTVREPVSRRELFPDNIQNDLNIPQENENDTLLGIPLSSPIKTPSTNIEGRRIVNIGHFFNELKTFKHLELFNCSMEFFNIVKENRHGLISTFTIKCENCLETKQICTENQLDELDINKSIILGFVSTGGGFSQLDEVTASCNIPNMSTHFYSKEEKVVADHIHEVAWKMMEAAGKEEAEIARNLGEVDNNGVPLITVIADGAWCKRAYNLNYNASSGVGCIVGHRTRKLLYLGIRNKYCCVCERAKNRNEEPKLHQCFKNWENSTTSMEADIIVEGFCKSVDMHGLKYAYLVGDGDSSVTKKLQLVRPYGNMLVHKIECRNHLLRNYCNKLRNLTTRRMNTKCNFVPVQQRNSLKTSIRRLRNAVTCAVRHHNNTDDTHATKILKLRKDLLNGPNHVFGDHTKCEKYFCKGNKQGETNKIYQLKESGLYDDILACVNRLACNASSLISNMDNNAAEHYNSIVAKFVGGKRINYSMKGSYNMRCEAASVSYNSSGEYYQNIYKNIGHRSPGKYTKKYIAKKMRILNYNKQYRQMNKQHKIKIVATTDADYGPEAQNAPDMLPEIFEKQKNEFLEKISVSKIERENIERETVGQANCKKWKDERAKRLNSSLFGNICKLRKMTSCSNTIKNMLYSDFSGSAATNYGKDHEQIARNKFEEITQLEVRECGLFIDRVNSFLASSPDGLVGDNALMEIKCPYASREFSIQEAITQKKLKFLCLVDGKIKIKDDHNYFYQIQGQLHITERYICYFVVWTPHDIHIEKVYRDDSFWQTKMFPKLKQFYFEGLLPEIIDPRYTRGQEIRDYVKN